MTHPLAAPPVDFQGAVRQKSALADDVRVRNHRHSIPKSWRSYKSGIWCYGLPMDRYYPRSAHFHVLPRVFLQYVAAFRNSGNVPHLRTA